MNRRIRRPLGFSLVEVTVALGVASLCLMAVFALLPIGVQTNRTAIGETAASSILAAVTADLRSTPKTNAVSTQFGISFTAAAPSPLYFDGEGSFSPTLGPTSRYRLTVTIPPAPAGAFAPTLLHLRVSWPAAASIANSSGSVETLGAFDRH
jgi:uncharacterized protein (TIGR02598 family)